MWVQEIKDQQNQWPYVIPLKEIYLFSDVTKIDFTTPADKKSSAVAKKEIDLLVVDAITVNELNARARDSVGKASAASVNRRFLIRPKFACALLCRRSLIRFSVQDLVLSSDQASTKGGGKKVVGRRPTNHRHL